METYTKYQELIRPTWAPPSWIFGPVWSLLYSVIFITYSYVAYLWWKGTIPTSVAVPFALNLVFNFSFTYFQFGLRNNVLASIDIVLCLITLFWALYVILPYVRNIAFANIPYLLWVSFATVLQLTITWLNR
jgi:benzodiazapine receptor